MRTQTWLMPVTRGDSYILLPNHIGPPASEVFTLHHYPTAQNNNCCHQHQWRVLKNGYCVMQLKNNLCLKLSTFYHLTWIKHQFAFRANFTDNKTTASCAVNAPCKWPVFVTFEIIHTCLNTQSTQFFLKGKGIHAYSSTSISKATVIPSERLHGVHSIFSLDQYWGRCPL